MPTGLGAVEVASFCILVLIVYPSFLPPREEGREWLTTADYAVQRLLTDRKTATNKNLWKGRPSLVP